MRILIGACVLLVSFVSATGQNARELTQTYAVRAGVVSSTGNEHTFQFLNGIEKLGLLTNLVDFAFFTADQNATPDQIVSLNNTGMVIGAVERLRGGVAFDNHTNNHGLYFTNLPPTPDGRTIVVWLSSAYRRNISNNVNDVVFEITGSGGPRFTPNPALSYVYVGGGNPSPYLCNGVKQVIGSAHPQWAGNSLSLASIASGSGGAEYVYKTDYPPGETTWHSLEPVEASPNVLRFAYRQSLSNPVCGWPGLIRGFAYFNKPLTEAEVLSLDGLVPRVGVIFEGDSKTIGNAWPWHYCQGSNTWGLYSILTNSAVGGTVAAAVNCSGNSMEDRWASCSRFKTNSQYPRILYHLRGGHNDFSGPGIAKASFITNAFAAITNLWGLARSNGYTVMGWTIDRTAATYIGVNSNYLHLLNGWIRSHSQLCDDLFDAEGWFVSQFGEVPFTNYTVYAYDSVATVHETPLGAEMLGYAVSGRCAPGFGPVPFALKLVVADAVSQKIEIMGLRSPRTFFSSHHSTCALGMLSIRPGL